MAVDTIASLIATLPLRQRLALSYAPSRVRPLWLGLLALDTRLAGVVRFPREPMLAQLRLAWWRERFASPLGDAPAGEPLLAALRGWDPARTALSGLVDGWEALIAPPPLGEPPLAALADARGAAVAALAALVGAPAQAGAAARMATDWALADLSLHLSDPRERDAAVALAAARPFGRQRLVRALRPLVILHALAARGPPGVAPSPVELALIVRIGWLGG